MSTRNLSTDFVISYDHLNFSKVEMVRHQGMVIAVAEATDPQKPKEGARLYYNILDLNQQRLKESEDEGEKKGRQEGAFVDKSWVDSQYWTGFYPFEFPEEVRLAGMSLLTFETPKLWPSHQVGNWAIVSGPSGHLFLFRSIEETIFGNRYLLLPKAIAGTDETRLALHLKKESRFRRSRMKDFPLHGKDAPSYQDMDDQPFIEPTISFHQHLKPHQNRFAACVAPGHLPGRHRWQFFFEKKVVDDLHATAVSILSSEDGWIDTTDIVASDFIIKNNSTKSLYLANTPTMTIFRPQKKVITTGNVVQTVPTGPRLLIAAPMKTSEKEAKSQAVLFDFPLQTSGNGAPCIPNPSNNIFSLTLPTISKDYSDADTPGKVSSSNDGWQGLSPEMGVIYWLETTQPIGLVDSADGRLHVYTVASASSEVVVINNNKPVTDAQLVTIYDLAAATQAEWNLASTVAKTTLKLLSRPAGQAANKMTVELVDQKQHYKKSGREATVPTFKTLTIKSSMLTETWAYLPQTVQEMALVLNGKASSNPRAPAVQAGKVPFYDYNGRYKLTRIWTTDTKSPNSILLVGSRQGPFRLRHFSVQKEGEQTRKVMISLSGYRLKKSNGKQVEHSPFVCNLFFKQVSGDTQLFAETVNFGKTFKQAQLTAHQGENWAVVDKKKIVEIAPLDVAGSSLLIMKASSSKLKNVAIQSASNGGASFCNVTMSDGSSTATWENISRNSQTLIQALNGLPAIDKNSLAQEIVAFGADFSRSIPNQTVAFEPFKKLLKNKAAALYPVLSTLYTVIVNGALGSITEEALVTTEVSGLQGVQRQWTEEGGKTAHQTASQLVYAFPQNLPNVGETVPILKNTTGAIAPTANGNANGWVQENPKSALSFDKTNASKATAQLSKSQAASLIPAGDFSVEAWVHTEAGTTLSIEAKKDESAKYCLDLTMGDSQTQLNFSDSLHHFQASSSTPVKGGWNHLAAVCSSHNALSFDGSQKAVCDDNRNFAFADAFFIDGIFQVDTTYTNQLFTSGLGHEVYVTQGGALAFHIRLDKIVAGGTEKFGGHVAISSDAHTVKDKTPYYFAIGITRRVSKKGNLHEEQTIFTPSLYLADLTQSTGAVTKLGNFYTGINVSNKFRKKHIKTKKDGTKYIQLDGRQNFKNERSGPAYLGESCLLRGELGLLRLWDRDLTNDAPKLAASIRAGITAAPGNITPATVAWSFKEGAGKVTVDDDGGNKFKLDSEHMWQKARLVSDFKLYINGQPIKANRATTKQETIKDNTIAITGKKALLSEFRMWGEARSPEEIADNMFKRCHGDEAHLLGYWPLSEASSHTKKAANNKKTIFADSKGHIKAGLKLEDGSEWIKSGLITINTAKFKLNFSVPYPAPPLGMDLPTLTDSIIRERTGWATIANSKIAGVEYGDLQTDASGLLHGVMKRAYAYIDKKDTKNKCFLVTGFKVGDLAMHYLGQVQTKPQLYGYIEGAPPLPSENMTRPYWKSPMAYQTYIGASSIELIEAENTKQTFAATKDTQFKASIAQSVGPSWQTEVAAGVWLFTTILKLGNKVVGKVAADYSLGWLSSAQVATGSDKSVSQSFTSSGNWEKEIKKKPKKADPDYQKYVIQQDLGRRYLTDNVGYALVKSRVANVYALRMKSTHTLVATTIMLDPDIPEEFNILTFEIDPTYTKQGTLDGKVGFHNDPDYPHANQERGSYFKPKEAYDLVADIEMQEAQLEAAYSEFDAGKEGRLGNDNAEETVQYGSADRAEWRQERRLRSMVNSYVWTASGGLYAEEEQTSISRQESSGGSYDNTSMLGIGADFEFDPGIYFDIEAMFGVDIHRSVTKTKEEGRDFSLKVHVDAEGFLRKWEEKSKDYSDADTPGKVTAYRFKTFYLAPDKNAFNTFFNKVVRRSWLESQHPDAIALRQAMGRPNDVWRILHRVTFVQRVQQSFAAKSSEATKTSAVAVTDIAGNQALIDKLAHKAASQTGTADQKISQAVSDYLSTGLATESAAWKKVDDQTRLKLEKAVALYMRSLGLAEMKESETSKTLKWNKEDRKA